MKDFIPKFATFSKIYDLVLENRLKGGDADNMDLASIANMHNVTLDHIQKQYDMGAVEEKEHSNDPELIDEIVKDHLVKDPNYYTKLKKVEDEKSSSSENNERKRTDSISTKS